MAANKKRLMQASEMYKEPTAGVTRSRRLG